MPQFGIPEVLICLTILLAILALIGGLVLLIRYLLGKNAR